MAASPSSIIAVFPGLLGTSWSIESPEDPGYNCIAWAAGDDTVWWEPTPFTYWPPGVPLVPSLPAYMQAYMTRGFSACDETDVDSPEDSERIAIFAKGDGIPTHAARQLPSGDWTSKLGQMNDIRHDLHALEGAFYGSVVQLMKRPREG